MLSGPQALLGSRFLRAWSTSEFNGSTAHMSPWKFGRVSFEEEQEKEEEKN